MSNRERTPRDNRNDSRSRRDDERRDRYRESRSRSRRRDSSYRRRDSSRRDPVNEILDRLNALEERLPLRATPMSTPVPSHPCTGNHTPTPAPATTGESASNQQARATNGAELVETPREADVADRIVGALSSLIQVRSKHYYISMFDPSLHDFDVWCAEVDRARDLNHWDDQECLGRIGGCLRGDAITWLNEWVTNDRSWTSFKAEFRSLCPREVDMATVLFNVMSTSSNGFTTYADYARRSLLRLNIVRGLSDELKTAIVIRGISDPQVKAAATNAKLQSKDLVEFLSVYVKPKSAPAANLNPARTSDATNPDPRKRKTFGQYDRLVCFTCGNVGHKQILCPKRLKGFKTEPENPPPKTVSTSTNPQVSNPNSNKPIMTCTFCRKNGHTVDTCFLKQRVDSKVNEKNSPSNVNFCSEPPPDITM